MRQVEGVIDRQVCGRPRDRPACAGRADSAGAGACRAEVVRAARDVDRRYGVCRARHYTTPIVAMPKIGQYPVDIPDVGTKVEGKGSADDIWRAPVA